jgi:hypothetical protein
MIFSPGGKGREDRLPRDCVVLGFMHLLKTFPLVRVVGSSTVVWFFLPISLTFSDYITRDWTTK